MKYLKKNLLAVLGVAVAIGGLSASEMAQTSGYFQPPFEEVQFGAITDPANLQTNSCSVTHTAAACRINGFTAYAEVGLVNVLNRKTNP